MYFHPWSEPIICNIRILHPHASRNRSALVRSRSYRFLFYKNPPWPCSPFLDSGRVPGSGRSAMWNRWIPHGYIAWHAPSRNENRPGLFPCTAHLFGHRIQYPWVCPGTRFTPLATNRSGSVQNNQKRPVHSIRYWPDLERYPYKIYSRTIIGYEDKEFQIPVCGKGYSSDKKKKEMDMDFQSFICYWAESPGIILATLLWPYRPIPFKQPTKNILRPCIR